MRQSKAEAEYLMEQQHYGGDYISPQDAGLADPDEEQDDNSYQFDHAADLCASCAHTREAHVNYTEDCCEAGCNCLCFKEEE